VTRRRTLSVYGSRPIGSRELIYAQTAPATATGEGGFKFVTGPDVVPEGRVAVIRSIAYEVSPISVTTRGLRPDDWRLSLLVDGVPVPGWSNLAIPPWHGREVEAHLVVAERSRIELQVVHLATNGPDTTGFLMRSFVHGQLLLATGEPVDQLIGHLR
jgi:hypothetical protein